MESTQEWQQSFVMTVGIKKLSHDPPPFCPTDHDDDIRVLVIRAAALTDNVHEKARTLGPH